jgi:hypothetical protein
MPKIKTPNILAAGLSLILVLGGMATSAQQQPLTPIAPPDPLQTWSIRNVIPGNRPPEAQGLCGYAFGANRHVIVGKDGLI